MEFILTKICFKCGVNKKIDEFYKHSQMKDGHVNKCKECNKKDVIKNYYDKNENPIWIEKERLRGREKYHRLNYKERQKITNENKPWKNSSVLKNLSRKLKTSKGVELHHWNYNDEFLEDVFILKTKQHRVAHRFLVLDIDKKIFKNDKGEYLDTKEKHLNYLLEKGIVF